MTQNKGVFVDNTQSKLLAPPHIVNKLIDLLVGAWQPTKSEQQQLTMHLSECTDCRIALSILLVIRGKYEAKEGYSERFIQDLSIQFITLHDQIEAHRLEYIGTYVEKILTEGQKKADKQFPLLAEYMKKSSSLRSVIKDTLNFLRETEKIDQRT